MIVIEKDGIYELVATKEEITYNLERLLKKNNDLLKLSIEEIKRVAYKTAEGLKAPEKYPIFSTENASEFFRDIELYWFNACQHEIDSGNYKQ